jgi:lysophospholipid acyltransferase (LPLAT)-like uncharacterized protein
MTRRTRWLAGYIAALAAVLIRLWMLTLRVRVASFDGQMHPADPTQARYLYTFWHETLLAPLATQPQAQVLISQHTDGEVIAQICQRLGVGVIRGSTARGGCQALLEMIRNSDARLHLAITPDGPRGPRRELKAGAVMVASQSGLAIVPTGIAFVRAWRAGSWDRFAIPLPFTTAVGVVGEPIVVPRELDRGGIQHWTRVVEQQMHDLTERAEDWALRLRREGSRAVPPAVPRTPALLRSA